MCRFSDAGNDDLTTRSGSRRPKSAKAQKQTAELQQILPVALGYKLHLSRPRVALVHEGHHFRARHIARIESLDVKAGVLYQVANCTVEMAAA